MASIREGAPSVGRVEPLLRLAPTLYVLAAVLVLNVLVEQVVHGGFVGLFTSNKTISPDAEHFFEALATSAGAMWAVTSAVLGFGGRLFKTPPSDADEFIRKAARLESALNERWIVFNILFIAALFQAAFVVSLGPLIPGVTGMGLRCIAILGFVLLAWAGDAERRSVGKINAALATTVKIGQKIRRDAAEAKNKLESHLERLEKSGGWPSELTDAGITKEFSAKLEAAADAKDQAAVDALIDQLAPQYQSDVQQRIIKAAKHTQELYAALERDQQLTSQLADTSIRLQTGMNRAVEALESRRGSLTAATPSNIASLAFAIACGGLLEVVLRPSREMALYVAAGFTIAGMSYALRVALPLVTAVGDE